MSPSGAIAGTAHDRRAMDRRMGGRTRLLLVALSLVAAAVMFGGCRLSIEPDCSLRPVAAVDPPAVGSRPASWTGGCMPTVVVDGVTYTEFGEFALSPEAVLQLQSGGNVDQRNADYVGPEFWIHPAIPQSELLFMTAADPGIWQLFTPEPGVLPVSACSLFPAAHDPPPDCSRA